MERRTFFSAAIAPVLGLFGWRPRKEENVALLEIPFLTQEKDGEDLTILFGVKGSGDVTLDVDQAVVTCLRDAKPGEPIDFKARIYPRGRKLLVREWDYVPPLRIRGADGRVFDIRPGSR